MSINSFKNSLHMRTCASMIAVVYACMKEKWTPR